MGPQVTLHRQGVQVDIEIYTYIEVIASGFHITGDEVDRDAVYFNWLSLAKNGIPENVPFAVRFRSDRPIVVTHKTHRAAYHTED